MRTSIQRAWPSKLEPKLEIKPEMKPEIKPEPVKQEPEIKETQAMVVSVDSKDLAAQISPILNDKFFLMITILCGTSVFCAVLCLCMAISMSSALRKIAQKI